MKLQDKNIFIFFIFLFTSVFTSCKKEYIGIHLTSHFENTQVLLEYNDQIILDSILTTNYSIVRAARLKALKSDGATLKVVINDAIMDSLKLNNSTKIVYVKFLKNKIEFIESNGSVKYPLY